MPGLPPGASERTSLARYGSWPVVLGTYIAALAASAALSLILADVAAAADELAGASGVWGQGWFLFLLILVNDVVLLGAVYLLLIRRDVLTWRQMGVLGAFGAGPVLRGVAWGVAFIVSSAVISVILAQFGVLQDQAQQFPIQGAGTVEKLGIFMAGVLIVPFAEEVFFRGFVFRAMSARKGLARGLVYSSLVFSAAHANLAALLPLAVGSLGLAYAYHRDRSLWTAIVAHAFNNAFALGLLLLSAG